jgi:predicted alpha/beta hydrolase
VLISPVTFASLNDDQWALMVADDSQTVKYVNAMIAATVVGGLVSELIRPPNSDYLS